MIISDQNHGTMKLEPSDEVLKELYRLRAENEKLRAATGSLVRSLSGTWSAFEPSLRREMGNTNYHCVKEKMDEVEALLDLRAAAALKETE